MDDTAAQKGRTFADQRSAAELGALLSDAKATLVSRWCQRVLDDPSVPQANRLPEPALHDHVPALIDRIVVRLTSTPPDIAERVVHEQGFGYEPSLHAEQRFGQGYSLSATLRELSHLRATIVEHLAAEHVAIGTDAALLVDVLIDEAMAEVADKFASRERSERERAFEILEHGLPVLAVDAGWNIVFVNASQEAISGMPRAETQGKSLWDVYPELRSPDLGYVAQYRRAMNERVPVHFEAYYTPWRMWTEQNVYPMRGGGVAIFFRDVTPRKRTERSRRLVTEISALLSESLDYQRTLHTIAGLLVQHLADYCMIDMVDPDGRFHRTEIAAADPTRLERMRQAEQFPPSSSPNSPFQQVLSSRKPMLVTNVTAEWLDALADHPVYRALLGELAPTSVMLVPLVVRDRAIGVLKILSTDQTNRFDERDLDFATDLGQRAAFAIDNARLYEQVRTDAKNLAEEAELRERFIAILSHDIRSPLTAVRLTAGPMVTDEKLPTRIVRGAQRIVRSVDRIERMVRDLLDFTRARHAGGIAIAPVPIDLAALVREVIDEVQVTFPDRSLDLATRGDPRGSWDRDRVAQVVNNLLVNALNYSPPDTNVAIEIDGSRPMSVALSVTNRGQPIPQEQLAAIFTPFKRAASQPSAGTGLGLGLYIASEIMRSHGGTLDAQSDATHGTTFTATLPRRSRASGRPAG